MVVEDQDWKTLLEDCKTVPEWQNPANKDAFDYAMEYIENAYQRSSSYELQGFRFKGSFVDIVEANLGNASCYEDGIRWGDYHRYVFAPNTIFLSEKDFEDFFEGES
ncbi:MAG TPA: hypothetical protein PLT28_00080 [Saprospiraceae bacterium]|nr:hypothetical protein [Saprospiraceae bacterium]